MSTLADTAHTDTGRPATDPVVLFVDDDPDIRLVSRYTLDVPGTVFVEAPDGETALTLAADLRPIAIVLDYRMIGLSGTETARLLLEQGYDGLIVLYSAHITTLLDAEARALGVPSIAKSEPEAVRRLIIQALDRA